MKNASVRFALVTLAFAALWLLFEHVMGWNSTRHDIGQYTRLVPMTVFWISLIVLIWYVRRNHGNTLAFREGFRAGQIATLVYCAGFTLVIVCYQQFIHPGYYESLKEFAMEQMRVKNAPQEDMERAMKEIQMQASGSPLSYFLLFAFSSIWGIGISAIASLFLRRTA